jgi:hypothetical protein
MKEHYAYHQFRREITEEAFEEVCISKIFAWYRDARVIDAKATPTMWGAEPAYDVTITYVSEEADQASEAVREAFEKLAKLIMPHRAASK